MKVISEEISCFTATMAIVNSKERAFRPDNIIFVGWLGNTKYDGNSIFIIVSIKPIVGVCCITFDVTIFLTRDPGLFNFIGLSGCK